MVYRAPFGGYFSDPFVAAGRLDWTTIDFKDNQPVIDLVSKKPKGLLVQLEEQGILGRRANNKALLQVCCIFRCNHLKTWNQQRLVVSCPPYKY